MEKQNAEQLQHYLTIATGAAQLAGNVLRKYWGKLKAIREKSSPGDLVTEADQEAEEIILNYIHRHYPSHGILAEESGSQIKENKEFTWVIDPLDGTTNYTHQFPMVSVSIGLLYKNEPIVGVIYNPIFEELFQAAKGIGSQLNGMPIQVSQVAHLSHSLLATGFPYDRREILDNNYSEFCRLTHVSQGVRRMGSAALDLAYVAAGKLDGFWETGLQPWDMAAGVVLVQEAGGTVSSYDSSPFKLSSGRILATNGKIHTALGRELLRLLI